MVGAAVIFEEEGAAREGPGGIFDALRDEPDSSAGIGVGSGTFGEAGKRSCTSGTDEDGPASAGMRVASTGGLVDSVGFETEDLVGGGRMDGRRGFGRRTGGVSCCRYARSDRTRVEPFLRRTYLFYLTHVVFEMFERRSIVLVTSLFGPVAEQRC